jgi:hypothetical protein
LLIALVVNFGASHASAQSGAIMVASDLGASNCSFSDGGPSVQPVYVFQMYTSGSRGVRFRLNVDGLGWTHLGDQPDFAATSGTSIDGIVICYDDCLTGNFKILTVNFFGSGLAPVCSQVTVGVYPEAGVEALDCDWNVVNPAVDPGIVNPDGSCDCSLCRTGTETACAIKLAQAETIPSPFCATSPVNQSTWGMIKSLYN